MGVINRKRKYVHIQTFLPLSCSNRFDFQYTLSFDNIKLLNIKSLVWTENLNQAFEHEHNMIHTRSLVHTIKRSLHIYRLVKKIKTVIPCIRWFLERGFPEIVFESFIHCKYLSFYYVFAKLIP